MAQNVANFNISSTLVCTGTGVSFTNNSTTTGAVTYLWNFGAGASVASANTAGPHIVSYSSGGLKTISLTVNGVGGKSISNKSISVQAPPPNPVFEYDIAGFPYASKSTVTGLVQVCAPVTGFGGMPPNLLLTSNTSSTLPGGTFSATPAGLLYSSSTGQIVLTGSAGVTYSISYSTNGPCPVKTYTRQVEINKLTPGNIIGPNNADCNNVVLTYSSDGSVQWLMTTNTGLGYQTPPPSVNILVFPTPTLITTIAGTTYFQTKISAGVCPQLDIYKTVSFTGFSNGGVASTSSNIICANTSVRLSVTGTNGTIRWKRSTVSANGPWVNETAPGNTSANYTTPGIAFVGNTFFAVDAVNGSCPLRTSNVITISSQFCTVTSGIVNTLTSSICVSSSSVNGTFFRSNASFLGIGGISQYRWDFGAGASPSTSTSSVPGLVTYSSSGIKTIRHTVTGPGAISISTKTITIDGISTYSNLIASSKSICGNNLVGFTVLGTNPNAIISWATSSVSGGPFQTITGAISTTYSTSAINNTQFFRVNIQSNSCPARQTTVLGVYVVPPIQIFTTATGFVNLCEGNTTTMSVNGINGNFQWQRSNNSITGWTNVSGGFGGTTSKYQTPFLTASGTYFYRSLLNSPIGCNSSASGVFVVSVTSCPIQGALYANIDKICDSNPFLSVSGAVFTSTGITISGAFWNFGSNAAPATSNSFTPPIVTFSGIGIQTIGFTITGFNEFGSELPFIASKDIYVYQRPTVVGFSSSIKQLCAGDSALIFYNPNNYPSGEGIDRWYSSTNSITGWNLLANSFPTYNTGKLLQTTFYQVRSQNGVCPIYTTPSPIGIIVTQPASITGFSYNNSMPICNTTTTVITPFLSASSMGGSFLATPGGLTYNPSGGITPNLSDEKEYTMQYTIPSSGGCPSVSTTTSIIINYRDAQPFFNYPGGGQYCTDKGLITPTFFAGFNVNGAFSSPSIAVNSFTGEILIDSTLSSNSHTINYIITPKAGCPTVSGLAVLTVTSKPIAPKFRYPFIRYCNDEPSIHPTITNTFSGGAFVITPSTGGTAASRNIYVDSITGVIYPSTVTSEDLYEIKYVIPSKGGCELQQGFASIYLNARPLTPIFDFPNSPYCGNLGPAVAQNKQYVSGGFFLDPYSGGLLDVNAVTGNVSVKNTNTNGTFLIQYNIPSNGSCKAVTYESQVTFRSLPLKPIFDYGGFAFCNNRDTLASNLITGISNGRFYTFPSNSTLGINTATGVLKLNSNTGGNFSVVYGVESGGTCGQVNSDTVKVLFEKLPSKPIFSYGSNPFCNTTKISLTSGINTVGGLFSVLPTILVPNPNNGDLFPSGVPQGVYTITARINSTNCPAVEGFNTVTILSEVSAPTLNYTKTSYCSDESFASLNITPTGGYFSPQAGLALNTLTGEVSISGSNSGYYDVIFTLYGSTLTGCGNSTSPPISLLINNKPPKPAFKFDQRQYCKDATLPPSFVNQQNLVDGFFSASSSVKFTNTTSGVIDIRNSAIGEFIVYYTVPRVGACAEQTGFDTLKINQITEQPFISYGSNSICLTSPNDTIIPLFSSSFTEGGNFYPDQNGKGLSVNSTTGTLTISNNTIGLFEIRVDIPEKNGCQGKSNFTQVRVTKPINIPNFKYSGSPFCNSGTALPIGDLQFGSFSANKGGLVFKDTLTGEIDLERSITDKYDVNYIIPAQGGCPQTNKSDTISIISAKAGVIESEAEKGAICGGNSINIRISEYKGNLQWLSRRFTDKVWFPVDGTMSGYNFTTGQINDSLQFVGIVSYQLCPPDSTNKIKIRVVPKSFGGTARPINDEYEICFQLNTQLILKEYVGTKIQWQFIRGDTVGVSWQDLVEGGDYTTDRMKTPNQNEYGSKSYYRAKVNNETCAPNYSNVVQIKVCDKDDFIPNALTPNSGDENSTWILDQLKLRDFAEVKIYNRYGSLVYSATGVEIREKPFDGQNLPTGTYWYVIDRKNGEKPLTNSITIIK